MARQERAVRTRQEVLRAAAEVFDRRGFAAATMSEILSVAGLTKGAVYFHFASKEELAHAVIAEQSTWAEQVDWSAPGFQAVIDVSVAYARALLDDPFIRATVRLVIEHGAFEAPDVEPWRVFIDMARQLLQRAEEAGDLLPGLDLDQAAAVVTASFTGIQLTSQVLAGRADLLERITAWWKLLLPGLVTPERLLTLDPGGSSRVAARTAARPAS
nr:ScbR family autoregulator-binding transcription factor [Streptacidiphilus pinicola]